jgi:hypothetical protein
MEKKKAEFPVIEVIIFEAADIITASAVDDDEWA